MSNESTLLSIAGSDPSGGAGIQADLKTMTAIGVYGAAAITCLTVQNSCGVQRILPLPADFVQQEIQAVLDDNTVTHIKIGMLGSLEIVQALTDILNTYTGKVVYDPVLAATTGQSLLAGKGLERIQDELLHSISYLSPNKQELEVLSGQSIQTATEGIASARLILDKYLNMEGVVVKGGHFEEAESTISDFLILRDGKRVESKRKRIDSPNLHGTGCTFASAFSSYLLLGNNAVEAFKKAGSFMEAVIMAGINKRVSKSGINGPLLHHLK